MRAGENFISRADAASRAHVKKKKKTKQKSDPELGVVKLRKFKKKGNCCQFLEEPMNEK